MKKKEPKFMQRCYDCRKLILTYDERNPDLCKRCFTYPRPVVTTAVITYNFTTNPPEAYSWK